MCGLAKADDCFDKGSLTYGSCGPSWTGFYLGAHAGVIVPDFDGVYSQGTDLYFHELKGAGFMAGGQIGYLYEHENNYVFGIELSGSWLDYSESAFEAGALPQRDQVHADLNYMAEARLRLGYAFDHGATSVMPYITGGIAVLDYEALIFEATPLETVNIDETAFGGVVGGGVEFLIGDGISIGAEGLYYFFDESTDISNVLAASPRPGDSFDLEGAGVLRARLNYHF